MNGQMVKLTVNGQETEARLGSGLLEVLRNLKLDIPTLCHDDRLTPYGGCRLCVVERKDGRGGMIPACSTPVQKGMVIETETDEVIESRRRNLQLLVLNHRMECPVCDRTGDCRFQDLIYLYGVPEAPLPFDLIKRPMDEKSLVIVRDPEKCILCGKCVRLCDEVQGVAEIGLVSRGLDAVVTTMLERPLNCEFCGQCVSACPVGALVARPHVTEIPPWLREKRSTACSWCSCGCELDAEVHGGEIQRVSAHPKPDGRDGTLCVKGWLGWDALSNPDRITVPLVRRDGHLVESTWDEALAVVAEAATKAKGEGRRLAAAVTPRLTSEDALLFRHFFIDGLGSEWTSLGPEAGVSALQEGVASVFGAPVPTASLQDVEEADFVLVVRGDPARSHPRAKNILVRRHRQREMPFALASTFTGGLQRHARPFLRVEPGTEPALLRFLARELAAAGRLDESVEGFPEWEASLDQATAAWAAEVTGVSEDRLNEVLQAMATARKVVVMVVTGQGLPGDETVVAKDAASLVAALGDRAGLLVLGEKGNIHGCIHAGLARVGPRESLKSAGADATGFLYLVGQDPAGAWPRSIPVREALQEAGFVVLQDAFMTETARAADVVLPAAILVEREGTGIGPDGSVRTYRQIVQPPSGALQDGEIFRRVAERMGIELPSETTINGVAAGLGPHEPQNPRLEPTDWTAPNRASEGFLLDGALQLFHSGSTTTRSRILRDFAPETRARIAPVDAEKAGLGDGDPVRLVAEDGEVLLQVGIDRLVAPGTIVVPLHRRSDGASRLVGNGRNAVTVQLRRS